MSMHDDLQFDRTASDIIIRKLMNIAIRRSYLICSVTKTSSGKVLSFRAFDYIYRFFLFSVISYKIVVQGYDAS